MIIKGCFYNFTALSCTAFITTTLLADVIVCPPQGDGRYPEWTLELINNEWEITLIDNDGYGGQWYIYSDEEGTDIIRFIKSETDDGGPTSIQIRDEPPPGHNCVNGCSGCYVKTVREISQLGTSDLWITLLKVTDDVGTIDAYAITQIDAGGDITGDIYAEYAIAYIDVVGNITGDIEVNNASLTHILVDGNIGTAILPVSISAGTYIRQIKATSINANITAGTSYSNLETTDGDFTGSLDCNMIEEQSGYSGIFIRGGDLDADITVTTTIDSSIYIDGNLDGDISVDADGITEQIIINAADDGSDWNGDITVDTTVLSGPYYTETSADIGGGAVSEAPFYYHATDCSPVHNGYITSSTQNVRVRHYGSINYTSGMPVVIKRRLITNPASAQPWNDVTSTYEVKSNTGTDLIIGPVTDEYWYSPFQYKIEPVLTSGDNQLRCVDVDGTPAVADYAYLFIDNL